MWFMTRMTVSACLATPLLALSQTFPVKPVWVVIPFPPGGSYDLVARLVASKVEQAWGQKMILDHRGGGNGMIGAASVARSAPDGYTILFTTPSSQITPVYLNKTVPYDPKKDFTPIAAVVEPIITVTVHSSVAANTLKELIDFAKRNPGKLSYGTSGTGSFFHLVGETFNFSSGVNIVHVPYKNIATAVSDVGGGHIPMVYTAVASALPFLAANKVKLLAVLLPPGHRGRYGKLPNVPNITETLPDFEKPPSWFAYFGPAGMMQPIVSRLNNEIVKAINAPDVRAKIEDVGMVVIGNTAEQFAAAYNRGFDVYGKITKAAGIEPE